MPKKISWPELGSLEGRDPNSGHLSKRIQSSAMLSPINARIWLWKIYSNISFHSKVIANLLNL